MTGRETDEELRRLVEEASIGDAEALDELFSRLYPYVMQVLQRHGLQGADADDIAAETFLKVFTAIKGSGGKALGAHPAAYLAAVARNIASHQVKRRRLPDASRFTLDEVAELHADVDLERDLEAADAVARALDVLDEDDRMLVQWWLVEGYSTAEIAERVGLAEEVVRTRLVRTRKRLAASMSSGDGD